MIPPSTSTTRLQHLVREPERVFPVQPVAKALVHRKPRVGNEFDQPVLCLPFREHVAVAPQQQRGHAHLTQPGGEVRSRGLKAR